MMERLEIEPLKVVTVPMQWGGRDSWLMWDKINDIIDYINQKAEAEAKLKELESEQIKMTNEMLKLAEANTLIDSVVIETESRLVKRHLVNCMEIITDCIDHLKEVEKCK